MTEFAPVVTNAPLRHRAPSTIFSGNGSSCGNGAIDRLNNEKSDRLKTGNGIATKHVRQSGTQGHLLSNLEYHNLSDAGESSLPRKYGESQIEHRSEFSLERRKGIRYRLNTSVVFRWSGPEDGSHQGEGITRDISVAGAFVVTATCPPPNSLIQMEIFFLLSDGGAKALMNADMMVLRVEHDAEGCERSGFSAVGKGFSLRTFSERATRLVDGLIKESEQSMKGQK